MGGVELLCVDYVVGCGVCCCDVVLISCVSVCVGFDIVCCV